MAMYKTMLRIHPILIALPFCIGLVACGPSSEQAVSAQTETVAQSTPAVPDAATPAPGIVAKAAVPAIDTPGQPRLVVQEELYLGEVENTGPIDFKFILRNEGQAPLEISEVKPSCGCTALQLESQHIEPGAETTLTAKLDLPNRTGATSKSITVFSNDPGQPSRQLIVRADLVKYLVSDPPMFSFGIVGMDAESSVTADLKSVKDDLTFNITEVEVIDGSTRQVSTHFKADVESVEAGKHYKVTVATAPPLPMQQTIHGNVIVHTDNERYPTVTIPVQGTAMGALMVTPASMLLPISQPGGPAFTRNILIRPGTVQSFEILEVISPDPSIGVSVTERPNIGYLVEISNLTPTAAMDGKEFIIRTDVESMKEIRVPIKLMNPQRGAGVQ